MFRFVVKAMNLKVSKHLIIWDKGSMSYNRFNKKQSDIVNVSSKFWNQVSSQHRLLRDMFKNIKARNVVRYNYTPSILNWLF